jgi:hypothetical protein
MTDTVNFQTTPVLAIMRDRGGAVAHADHKDFAGGAKGDGRGVTDGAMTTGSATFTSATAAFTAADSGKAISVDNAGTPVAGTGTLTAAAGVGTFSTTQTGILGESTGVIVGGVLYLCTAWNAAMTSCTLSGAPTFGAAAFSVAKTLLTTLTYVSATTATLGANAGQTVSAATAHFGTDNTAALQAAIDACSASNLVHGTVPRVQLGIGQYKITGKLRFKSYRVAIWGADMDQSAIHYEGVSAGCLVVDAIAGLNIDLSNFSIYGDASSGHGIDTSAVTVDPTYLSRFSRLKILAGKNAIWSPILFSASLDDVYGESRLEHIYRIRCGPSVAWKNVYASRCPAGKAGYRIAGTFHPVSCNGVNSGGYWGIFGSNNAATDGFQNDFPGLTDYPDVVLYGCNIEAWSFIGLYAGQLYQNLRMVGGSIVRTLAGSYHSVIRTANGPLTPGQFIDLDGVRAIITGGTNTAAGKVFSDYRDKLRVRNDNTGFTGSYSGLDSTLYAVVAETVTHDANTRTYAKFTGVHGDRVKATNFVTDATALAYGTTVSVDASLNVEFEVTPTDGVGFTIANATNAFAGAWLEITIINTFGVLGAVTWGSQYKLSAWTQPANGFSRAIRFKRNAANNAWVEKSRTPADVPN